ncbi:MAG: hypothetical protein ACXWJ2_03930 [Hyphomicrobium sp.]
MRRCRGPLIAAALLSSLINVLALAGSVYTLEIYNRILPSRSELALALLTLAMVALHATSASSIFSGRACSAKRRCVSTGR